MRVFIGGSKSLNTLHDVIKEYLNNLAASGAEILIGDCDGADALVQQALWGVGYCNVRIYVSGEEIRNNVGNWPVIKIPVKHKNYGKLRFWDYRKKDLAMADTADAGFMLWNGKSKGTFADIVDLINREKPVCVYLAQKNEWMRINSRDDLRQMLASQVEADQKKSLEAKEKIKADVLATFLFSGEMRAYLMEQDLSSRDLSEIICGAPVSLSIKAKWMKKLAYTDEYSMLYKLIDGLDGFDAMQDRDFYTGNLIAYSFSSAYKDMKEAICGLQLQKDEIFCLKEMWYDDELCHEKECGNAPYLSLEKALEYIKNDIAECEPDDEITCWYELQKWVPDGKGNVTSPYTYFLIGDEVVYFEKNEYDAPDWHAISGDYSYAGRDLNLPVPFHAGDIVTIDCTPFAPKKQAVLLEVGKNRDCCCVQALWHSEDGTWDTGAVKHSHLYKFYRPMLSPLYRLQRYSGKLAEKDSLLGKVCGYLDGSEEKGLSLWNCINDLPEQKCGEYSETDILNLLN